jgi:hypothetical protein
MSAAHTPGPWWVTDGGVRNSGGLICRLIKAFHYPGQDARFEKEVAERLSNARLIAAAPELLEALETISAWNSHTAEFSMDYGSSGVRDLYRGIARAAIDKATGATP